MILDAFRKAFFDGCGLTQEQAIQSVRYQQLVSSQRMLSERYAADTAEGIALRAGHLLMGKLFNTLPEKEALRKAKGMRSLFGHGIEWRALITLLGEEIIRAATRCLPPDIIAMAEEWKEVSPEWQIEIARELYFLFQSQSQRREKTLNWQVLDEELTRSLIEEFSESSNAILPLQYGLWDKDISPANCQGKTQMLIAFARLADAEVMTVHSITSAKDTLDQWRRIAKERLSQDIEERGIEYPDPEFAESMAAEQFRDSFNELKGGSFHLGAALQLKDGRWVLVDPHGMDWGVFSESWDVPSIFAFLKKYQEALPGLTLLRSSREEVQNLFEQKMRELDELLARSRNLERAIGPNPQLPDIVEALKNSEEMEFILGTMGAGEVDLSDPKKREYAAWMIGVGDMTDPETLYRVMGKDVVKKRIGSVLTIYHYLAMQSLRDQVNDAGVLLHPECEFSLPEYSIAMSIINSLCKRETVADKQFFLDYVFDQVALYNAIEVVPFWREVKRGSEMPLVHAAAEALQALPFIHTMCRKKLQMYVDVK